MIPGIQSDTVDSQTAFKKIQGKALTNTRTFSAQEPVSQLKLSADSVWSDSIPTKENLIAQDSILWDAFNADVAANGHPEAYYEVNHPEYMLKQVLIHCKPNSGTEYYSFDLLDNESSRVVNIITTSFGNYFQSKLWMWNGNAIGKRISPISGLYWQVDSDGYLYTADKTDPDYSETGFYIMCYVYTGARLSQNNSVYQRELLIESKTEFILNQPPVLSSMRMLVNGLPQSLDTDFTVSNTTLTWISSDFILEIDDLIEFTFDPV